MLQSFKGSAFRAHNPKWAFQPESGEGAASTGGRFNPPGTSALYLSLGYESAIIEAQQGFPGKFQPLTICSYSVELDNIADLRDPTVRDHFQISEQAMACGWAMYAVSGDKAPSWAIAEALRSKGACGILVPSYANNAKANATNLVLLQWDQASVKAIDDDNRLPINQDSWLV